MDSERLSGAPRPEARRGAQLLQPRASSVSNLGRQAPNGAGPCGTGQIERDRKNIGAALKHYQIAVELLRKQDDPLILAHTVRHVADILLGEGNLEPAQRHYEEALAIYCAHETTPPLDLANALRGYALLMEESRKIEEATMLWRQANALYEQLEIEAGVTESQSHLAFLMGR